MATVPEPVPEILTYDEASSEKSPPDRLVSAKAPGLSEVPRGCVPRTLSHLDVPAISMSDTGTKDLSSNLPPTAVSKPK
jgi:hypothetical protein